MRRCLVLGLELHCLLWAQEIYHCGAAQFECGLRQSRSKHKLLALRLGCARAVADGALSATTAECLVEAGGVPLVLSHGYGDGRAILWNFGAARAGRKQQTAFIEALLRTVPVEAPFRLSRPAGSQVSVLRRGDLTLVGVVTPARPDEDLVLSWQEP